MGNDFTPNATAADAGVGDKICWTVSAPNGSGMRNLHRVRVFKTARVLSYRDTTQGGVAVRIFRVEDMFGENVRYVTHRMAAKIELNV